MFSGEPSGRTNHSMLFTPPGQPPPVAEKVSTPAFVLRLVR